MIIEDTSEIRGYRKNENEGVKKDVLYKTQIKRKVVWLYFIIVNFNAQDRYIEIHGQRYILDGALQ